jgi:hypothetical protein
MGTAITISNNGPFSTVSPAAQPPSLDLVVLLERLLLQGHWPGALF